MTSGRISEMVGRRRATRRTLLWAGSAGLGAAFVAACGGDSKSTPGSGSTGGAAAPVATAATAAAVENVKTGGVYQLVLQNDPPSTDPFKHASYVSQLAAGFPYSKLMKHKTGDGVRPNDFDVTNDLAESYQINDPLTYTFKLRPGVKFHDIAPVNGRALDAQDVVYSFNRFMSISVYKGNVTPVIDKVEAPDASTVVVKLKKPDADFLSILADGLTSTIFIFPKEAENYDTIKTVIGTGAWLFDGLQPGIATTWKRNPNYFLKDEKGRQLPYLDGIKALTIPEYAQQLAQFQAGNIHLLTPKAPDLKSLRQAVPGHELLAHDVPLTFQIFAFRQIGAGSTSPFNDERVRRAVSMAIDRDGLITTLSNEDFYKADGLEIQKPWHNIVGAGLTKWWLDPKAAMLKGEEWAKWYKFDIAEAKKLLTAAGHPNGFEVEYHRTVKIYGDTYDDAAEAYIPMLNAIGIKTKVLVHDYSSKFFPDIYTKGDFNGMGNILQSFSTPSQTLFAIYHPDGPFNRNKWNDPQVVDLIKKQGEELDAEKRKNLVYDAQRYISNTMHNVPLLQQSWTGYTIGHPFVKNWRFYRNGSNSYSYGSQAHLYYWLDK
jgi:peptide/nickel transport system substrate-binding protein